MKQQTAVEWLYNELSKNNTSTDSVIERINKESSIWEQAKQMEQEQRENEYWKGREHALELQLCVGVMEMEQNKTK